MFFAEDM